MKHIGILAHSVEGAALCLQEISRDGFRRLGDHQHPDVTLDCIAMGRSMPAWDAGDYASIRPTLAESVDRLARAGADFFICPDNTAHLALEVPGEDLALPGLHIVEVVADRAAHHGFRQVGVLGTKYTMDGPLYPRTLAGRGISSALPTPEERRVVDDIIFRELVNGVFTEPSRRKYVEIIEAMADGGCDAVALVCTEIPLLVSPEVSPLPTLDSTCLLAGAGVDVALGTRPMPSWRGGPI